MERNLSQALSEMSKVGGELNLPRNVTETAAMIYRRVVQRQLIRGRTIQSVAVACIYMACRQCRVTRSLDDVAAAASMAKKDAARTYRFLLRARPYPFIILKSTRHPHAHQAPASSSADQGHDQLFIDTSAIIRGAELGTHVAVVGNGRIGRPTAYSLLIEGLMDELSLVDTKPGLAWAFGEELKHGAASLNLDVEINTYEVDEGVCGADLVVVCPGKPRAPGVQMDRRDLATQNAETINHVAEVMPPRNPGAKWIIVTNPVDAMATLFKRVSGESFVISTGDCPDTLRFRAKLNMDLGVPVSLVEGYVGGEHGAAAYPLWSTTKIMGTPLDEYLKTSGRRLDREGVTAYVRGVSKRLVDTIGATEFGPAAGFRGIVGAVLRDSGEMFSVADSVKFPDLPEAVHVSIPTHVGEKLGPSIWEKLLAEEQASIRSAAEAIYMNYRLAWESLDR